MARQYPSMGEWGKAYDPKVPNMGRLTLIEKSRECYTCPTKIGKDANPAFHVDIQVSWFRGEDDVYFFCEPCYSRFLNLYRHKTLNIALGETERRHEKKDKGE